MAIFFILYFYIFSTLHWVGFFLGMECISSWIGSIAISTMTIFLSLGYHMHQLAVTIGRNRSEKTISMKAYGG